MAYGDIFWIDIPFGSGREQAGRRPAVIWQDTAYCPANITILVIPLTSRQRSKKYPATLLLQPSTLNGLTSPSVALVFQLTAIDVQKVGARMGEIDAPDLDQMQVIAKALQRLP